MEKKIIVRQVGYLHEFKKSCRARATSVSEGPVSVKLYLTDRYVYNPIQLFTPMPLRNYGFHENRCG